MGKSASDSEWFEIKILSGASLTLFDEETIFSLGRKLMRKKKRNDILRKLNIGLR